MNLARCVCLVAVLLAASVPSSAADLSPAHWPVATRATLDQESLYYFPAYAASAKGRSALVVATASPVAAHAGMETLRQGGTAADAAATVALTQVVQRLGSDISYAGVMRLIYFDAKTGKVSSLDGTWGSYAQETDPQTIPDTDLSVVTGKPAPANAGVGALGRQTLVPGFMAGIEAMHSRFGRLPFADLFQPAIWYAEKGVTISPALAAEFHQRETYLKRTADGRRFASMPDGSLPKLGDVYRQPELARTLRAVAAQGAGFMYTGDWARAFVAAVNAEGGKVTMADFQTYKAAWREPFSVSFEGATVYSTGGEADAGCQTLETLNLLAGLRIEGTGPYWRDPKALVSYVHALRFAIFGHSAPVIAEMERSRGFSSDCRSRLSRAYAASFTPTIASETAPPLDVPNPDGPPGNHTESVVVVDRWGDVAVLVHTINCVTWSDTGIVVGGIPIGDAAAINKDSLAAIKPGSRVPEDIAPVIALRNSKPVLAVAGVGSAHVPEAVRLVGGVLANGTDLRTLLDAPAMLGSWNNIQPGSLWAWPESVPQGAYDPKLQQAVRALGLPLKVEPLTREQWMRGTAAVAVIDQPSGAPSTAIVPQLDVFAEADRSVAVEEPREIHLPVSVLDRYIGDYSVGRNVSIHLYRRGGRLFSDAPGRPTVELFATSETEFFEKVENVKVRFERDARGQFSRSVIHRAQGDVVAVRKNSAELERP